jgi:hypothetical protein
MSIQEKLGNISQKIENKKAEQQISEKEASYSDLMDEKKSIVKKIETLRGLYSNLKELYSSSGSDIKKIKEFKNKVKEIEDYFSENKEELLLINIESVEDLLSAPDFKNDQESKDILEYRKDGFARNNGEELGDKLREKVSQLSETKIKIKEELPDEELKFTGEKDSEGSSPRKEALEKIEKHIDYLSGTQLKELDNKIKESKKELLVVLNKMIEERVDNIFLDDNFIRNIGKKDFNYQFISDNILKLCNNDLWPTVKDLFTEKMFNKKAEFVKDDKNNSRDKEVLIFPDIKNSLNAEKMVFDVEELKNNNKNLMKAIIDKENFKTFNNNFFNGNSRLLNGDIIINDGKIFRKDSVINKEYFDEKNEEAKIIFEEVRENILKNLNDLNNELKTKIFDGRDVKNGLVKYKEYLSDQIDKINKIDSDEKIFKKNNYSFWNKNYFMGRLNDCEDLEGSRLNKINETRKKIEEESKRFENIYKKESSKLGKFLNDNYNLSNSREEEKSFGIPYYDFKYRLKELFPENNIDNINNFIVSLEGKSFSYEEINKVFNDEKERLNKNIKEYPNYNEVFLEFSELSGSIRENYEMFISKLVIKDPEKASKAKNNNNYQIRNFFL